MEPVTFFRNAAELRKWFAKHHGTACELWVGYYKKDTGIPSVTWPESVDEALCVGWIDGIRKTIDDRRYRIRFTPRKASSIWSAVNMRRAKVLIDEGRMLPAGLAAYEKRRENKIGIYAYEQRQPEFEPKYERMLKKNKAASEFFQTLPPYYRKQVTWYVTSAKKKETRLARMKILIARWAAGRRE
jgi:uncharacterized protein YdeI (YjbR/CyaY-like superfamily)